MWITAPQMKRFAPNAMPDIVDAILLGWPKLDAAGINTPLRLAHFLAQLATETGGFTIYVENMNYSAKRLTQVWPTHFPTIEAAMPYAKNPEKLANYIYADKNRSKMYRLGNTQEGDGWLYRGRGLIQTTGRDNYRKAGYEDTPDVLSDPDEGLVAAIGEWTRTGCNALADADKVEAVRKKINGGLIGIADCKVWLAKAKRIFVETEDGPPTPTTPKHEPPVVIDYEPNIPVPISPPDREPPTPAAGGFLVRLVRFLNTGEWK